jgi:hypothetical protein
VEESAVRLDPSPIPKGNSTANFNSTASVLIQRRTENNRDNSKALSRHCR